MHELSICQALIREVSQVASQHDAPGVTAITLRIGPLSGVVPELLMQAFPLAAAGSIAAQANMTIETLPIRVHCRSCGADSDATVNRLICADCGDWHTSLISGDELLLASVELQAGEDIPERLHGAL